ncbi:hypothetical protein PVK64_14975 [Aliivibrio sp. S4TY2]|uniref:Uncharacterized protein n=1 Tax=Aliivibrio finisterrensis TaxID=511998 RepID=A0A4Q5KMY0_9GAMM|nr:MULTISPECIES: hypothetical protein [Aliivibrio]MDD9157475.1 hypothetical protein [Aliivibrio sp. S4TY2]MDD9161331.1 hypothetical protein [Aliivibrio sp. S4TY1]MDD9165361.1 hypothetical protein [Aliivibrio sp. S4MY2]MDD9169384.1 hypothetical protein [Aliivibrio sp. S4MY4]MDD9179264.1 hypothetical protein [Aliivibrio sp. A6]
MKKQRKELLSKIESEQKIINDYILQNQKLKDKVDLFEEQESVSSFEADKIHNYYQHYYLIKSKINEVNDLERLVKDLGIRNIVSKTKSLIDDKEAELDILMNRRVEVEQLLESLSKELSNEIEAESYDCDTAFSYANFDNEQEYLKREIERVEKQIETLKINKLSKLKKALVMLCVVVVIAELFL